MGRDLRPGQCPSCRVDQLREPTLYSRPPRLLVERLVGSWLQTLPATAGGQVLADRLPVDVQCLIDLHLEIGRRSNAGTSPRSLSRSTISSPAQAPSRTPAHRLRSVVDATLPLREPGDGSDGGLAELAANYKLCVDSYGTHIAVEHSSFALKAKIERTPIIRRTHRKPNNKPRSHVQITAHRGALTHILSRLNHKTPHSIESLHIPMGGERFRPCLEDVIEFLIRDCGFQGSAGWKEAIRDGRARWRRIQTHAVVRDALNAPSLSLSRFDTR